MKSPNLLYLSSLQLAKALPRITRITIVPLLLVFASGSCGLTAAVGQPKAERIYEWGFYHSDDRDSDLWPDGWQRRRDAQHPAYIDMHIAPRKAAVALEISEARKTLVQFHQFFQTGKWDPNFMPETTPSAIEDFLDHSVLDNCLEIHMDGGAAEMISPRFELDPRFSYRLQAELSTDALHGHRVWIELRLYDSGDEPLGKVETEHRTGTTEWRAISVQLDTPPSADLKWGRLHIMVEPQNSVEIHGVAKLDNLLIDRLARLQLTTSVAHNVAEPNQSIRIECTATGLKGDVSHVQFEIVNLDRQLVATEAVPLQYDKPTNRPAELLASTGTRQPQFISKAGLAESRNGTAVWTITMPEPGAYTVSAFLGSKQRTFQQRSLLLAVIENRDAVNAGPFGWSLPAFGPHLRPGEVPEIATRFGAGWLKYPIWFDMEDTAAADELVTMTERLQAFGIRCIGRIDEPPPSQRAAFTDSSDELYARTIFQDTESWEPLLEPVLTRMGMRLAWFQLGRDEDLSLIGDMDSVELFQQIRETMQSYCQQLKLTVGWDWLQRVPAGGGKLPWDSVHYRTSPQLTARELGDYVRSTEDFAQSTWVNLQPLQASKYSLQDRVQDLTERVIEIRRAGIEAAFLPNPFDPQSGIFELNRNATEMLIPWYQLVSHCGDSEYLGPINMPEGSANHVFAGEGEFEGCMLIWNSRPVEEQQFIGMHASATDIWGKPVHVENVVLPNGTSEQRIAIGQWPLIIKGVNIDVVRVRQNFQIELSNLASRVGETQVLPVSISNPFNKPMSGELTLVCESLLSNGKVSVPLQIPGLRPQKLELPIDLRRDASAGEHKLRFEFNIKADDNYRFSVYRDITLGLGDIRFEWETVRRNAVIVELRMELVNNLGVPISFDCKLFPPGLPYQRFQVNQAQPGTTINSFNLNIPESANIEDCWLRCEGIGLGRVLNYRIKF